MIVFDKSNARQYSLGMKEKTDPPVVSALFGATRRSILFLLCAMPQKPFYSRQLVNAVSTGQGGVYRELKNLEKAGIILRFREGHRVRYMINQRFPALPELRQLLKKLAEHSHTRNV